MNELLSQQAVQIIQTNLYLTLSTSDKQNIPWISPLFYATDDQHTFYWVSPKKSRHSINIEQNPRISWVIFNSTAPKWTGVGVYFTGNCYEVCDTHEIKQGLTYIFNKLEEAVPSTEEYIDSSIYSVYKAIFNEASITHDITENGKTVDARVKILITPPQSQEQ